MALPSKLRATTSLSDPSNLDMGTILPGRRNSRVMVVDDNEDVRLVMRELLSSRGYNVIAVGSVAEAENEIRRQLPDLILSDVMMPGKTGYEFCRELKSNPATRLIPFVLITGLTDRESRLQGIEAGADDFLNKPIFSEELYARAKSLLTLKEFTDELETAESILCTLGLSVESRDPYTAGHCERLSEYAVALGEHLGLENDALIALRRGGYLHDLGKISVPDEILKKGSDLTLEEWVIMKQHPVAGENICKPLKSLSLVLPIIRNHHEHCDGSGYPDGLLKNETPLLARVLQIVGVYDALRTARSYKAAFSHETAAATMQREALTGLWDAELVKEFLEMMDKQQLLHKAG